MFAKRKGEQLRVAFCYKELLEYPFPFSSLSLLSPPLLPSPLLLSLLSLPFQASAFDSAGRPLEAAFYTGSPAYHNLVYEILCQHNLLDAATERKEEERGEEREEEGSGEEREVEEREEERGEVPMQWVKKETLSNTIAEEISDKQVSHRNSRTQEPISVVYNHHTHTHTHT